MTGGGAVPCLRARDTATGDLYSLSDSEGYYEKLQDDKKTIIVDWNEKSESHPVGCLSAEGVISAGTSMKREAESDSDFRTMDQDFSGGMSVKELACETISWKDRRIMAMERTSLAYISFKTNQKNSILGKSRWEPSWATTPAPFCASAGASTTYR